MPACAASSRKDANVLPGFLGIGFGLGLAFVAVPLLVLADIRDADTGMASGMMQTAHEIGISLGVAVISAVATAGTAEAGFETGFREALFAAALIAGVLVAASLIAVPSVRPAPSPPVPAPSAVPGSARV